jgi:hypothetical protein
MRLLRAFSVIIALVFIIASSNISFKSVNDVNSRINTKAPLIDGIHLYIDDKSTFSSLLQTISAQVREQHEVDQEDNGNDSDSAIEREEGQDRGDGERESSVGQEKDQQDNKEEQNDKEKLSIGEEASLDNKENGMDGENPISMEQQNNNTSSGSSDTEDKAQNSQNRTDSHTTTTDNNASLNEFRYTNASAPEDNNSFTLKCQPEDAEMLPGEEGSITCTIENKTPKPIKLVLECSGLQNTGIECYINGEHLAEMALIKETSHTNFSVLIISHSSPPVPAGSYPFTIRAEECINSDLC